MPLRFPLILFFTCFCQAQGAAAYFFSQSTATVQSPQGGDRIILVDFTGLGSAAARAEILAISFPVWELLDWSGFLAFWPAKRFRQGRLFRGARQKFEFIGKFPACGQIYRAHLQIVKANIGEGQWVVRVVRVRHVNIFQDDP